MKMKILRWSLHTLLMILIWFSACVIWDFFFKPLNLNFSWTMSYGYITGHIAYHVSGLSAWGEDPE